MIEAQNNNIVVKNGTINELLLLSKDYAYASYIKALTKMYPLMLYSLPNCLPCENAKLLLKTHYSDIPFHYLDTALVKGWHEKMYLDLQRVTGSPWFPYIFTCGNYIGGSIDLFNLHLTGKLREKLNLCAQKYNTADSMEE
uniref:Glutaredoxin domain-containing protein n=1 Tax=Acrobeloides nanus TaxID=290746 RepID=A0A914E0L2_9BILA